MNDTEYPALDNINTNFTKNQYMQFYKMMADFPRDFYGIDPLVAGNAITPLSYKDLFPLYIFNVSKQSDRINQGVVDVTVKMQFSEGVGANARAYALIISDIRLKLESDGNKMHVLY